LADLYATAPRELSRMLAESAPDLRQELLDELARDSGGKLPLPLVRAIDGMPAVRRGELIAQILGSDGLAPSRLAQAALVDYMQKSPAAAQAAVASLPRRQVEALISALEAGEAQPARAAAPEGPSPQEPYAATALAALSPQEASQFLLHTYTRGTAEERAQLNAVLADNPRVPLDANGKPIQASGQPLDEQDRRTGGSSFLLSRMLGFAAHHLEPADLANLCKGMGADLVTAAVAKGADASELIAKLVRSNDAEARRVLCRMLDIAFTWIHLKLNDPGASRIPWTAEAKGFVTDYYMSPSAVRARAGWR
jgi:hypothetical protein